MSRQLPQSTFEAVTLNRRVPVFWNNESDPAMLARRDRDADVERCCAESLSFARDPLQIGAAGDPLAPSEAMVLARR